MYKLHGRVLMIIIFGMIWGLGPIVEGTSNTIQEGYQVGNLAQPFAEGLNSQSGTVLFVDPVNGNDNNNGGTSAPFRTLGHALAQLSPGDTLIMRPGYYQEHNLYWDTLRSNSNSPVTTIRAETPGTAIITASWPAARNGTLSWDVVDAGLGLYRAPWRLVEGQTMETYYARYNGIFLPYYKNSQDLRQNRIRTPGFEWGVGDDTYEMPAYGITHEDGYTYIRLPNGANPNGKSILFSGGWTNRDYDGRRLSSGRLWSIDRAPNLLIDGLQFHDFYGTGMYFYHGNVVVRNTVFENVHTGARFRSNSVMEWSEYAFPGFNDFAIAVDNLNVPETNKYNSLYGYVKHYNLDDGLATLEGHLYDGAGRDINNNFEARYNFMHNAFDGGRIGEFHNSSSHDNVYLYIMDNAEELETWSIDRKASNLHFYNNLILAGNYGPISHQGAGGNGPTGDIAGPQYVYRNVIIGLDERGWEPWTVFKTSGSDGDDHYQGNSSNPRVAEFARNGIFYYHNTIYIKRGNLYWHDERWDNTLDNLRFFNNLLLFEDALDQNGDPVAWGTSRTGGNVLVAQGDYPTLTHNNGLFLNNGNFQGHMAALFNDPSLGLVSGNLDFTLTSNTGNPAVNRAVSLPSGLNDSVSNAGDSGAFERGQNVQTLGGSWPRPIRRVFNGMPFGEAPILIETGDPYLADHVPIEIEVNLNNGNPEITVTQDESISWYHLYIGQVANNTLYTTHAKWYEAATMDCGNDFCTFASHVYPTNGDFVVYMQTWNGFSMSPWTGPVDFVLNEPAIDSLNLRNAGDDNPTTFRWDAADGGTWYELWVGTSDFMTHHWQWYSAIDLECDDGGICGITLDTPLVPGETHVWYLRAWGPAGFSTGGINGWYEGNEFVAGPDETAPVATIEVIPNDGLPLINVSRDTSVDWYHVYIGYTQDEQLYTFHTQWYDASSLPCADGLCTIEPNINPTNGDYVVYIQTWGDENGYSTGGFDGWAGPSNFNINEPVISTITGYETHINNDNQPNFEWDAPDGATWYQIWVGTDSFQTYYVQWHSASDLGCHGGGACQLDLDLSLNNGGYTWYLQAWGPAGFSTGGVSGWYDGTPFNVG